MDEILLTPEDLATRLKTSKAFIYKLVREKSIPYFHIGKSVRFSPSKISAWLETTVGNEYHRDKKKKLTEDRASLTN